ncbi:hypothetical protein THOG05_20023 [Vibrio rotiferianus]|nr:hypothetical protein THOG05_20023 [Vibrio rotiferianus]CAH1570840.1 hypothetical protein THOE12_30110 [Vibrio rotiferianus]CAH1585124.1 hypothetical protein THOG10_380023 [Vibrio rotiferianus]CAH1587226.1 hypothetical protein THOB06_380023 [Vibrio rotiferianus]
MIVAYHAGSCLEDYENYALFSSPTDRLVVPACACSYSGRCLPCRSCYRQ